MTPEQVKAIAEAAWIQPHYRPLDVAIERAIRQAVNEFADEAAKDCVRQARMWPSAPEAAGLFHAEQTIRALKLPEE